MRPLLGIVALVAVAIGLSMFASKLHPGGDLPPAELQAEKDRADADKAKEAIQKRKDSVKHSDQAFDEVKAGAIRATLVFAGKKPIQIEMYPAAAPKTVAHIQELLKNNFYKGIKVHRYEDGSHGLKLFQLGDPMSVGVNPTDFLSKDIGTHGSQFGTVPLEVKLPHTEMSVGLARAQPEDSGDSQFYVNTGDNGSIDGSYCIFGRVINGQDVAREIRAGDVVESFSLDK